MLFHAHQIVAAIMIIDANSANMNLYPTEKSEQCHGFDTRSFFVMYLANKIYM